MTYGNSGRNNYSVTDTFNLQVVPEPGTYFLLLVGMAGLGLVLRRRAARA